MICVLLQVIILVHPVFEYILKKTEHDSKGGTMAIFNGYESNQNAEGACVERLSEQAALKAARRQAEPIPEAFVQKMTPFRDEPSS